MVYILYKSQQYLAKNPIMLAASYSMTTITQLEQIMLTADPEAELEIVEIPITTMLAS